MTGCATIIKGYESPVELYYAPDSLAVSTIKGENMPIRKIQYSQNNNVYYEKIIFLRSNETHVLRLTSKGKEKVVSVYPKLSPGWFLLDLVCGGFPVLIDLYTGAWLHFDDINAYMD